MSRIKQTSKSKAPPVAFQKKEILKCGRDPIYFINTYVKISEPVRGLIPFNTFPYQDECVDEFKKNQFVIVNKSRQLGLSTVCAAYALWLCLFQKEKNILVIATKLEVAKNFQNKVFTMYDSLPNWLVMPQVVQRSVRVIKFSNGSKVQAVPTSADAGRGEALSLLIVDEAAHVEGIDELWLALFPTLSTGGRAILLSTPNGVGNLFHRIWTEAQEGSNGFKSIEIPWYKHPERNQEWFETQAKAIRSAKGERGVAQELLCDFLSSGETFITSEYMDILSKKLSDPILKHDVYPDIFVWKRPEPGHNYLVTADVSRGNAKDFSAMCVIDINKDEVVADYKGKVPADKLADIMIEVGKFYNNALLCPELNTYGLLTAKALKDQEYPNLFYEKLQKNIYSSYTEADIGEHDLPGIQTTVKNRDEMLAKLENVLRNGHILIQSKRFHEELKTFIWKNGKAQAQKGYNDDLVMAYCLAVNLYNNSGTSKYSDEEIAMAMIAGMSNNKDTFSPWGQGSQQDHNAIPIFTSNGLSQHNKFLEHKRKLALQNKINPQSSETANNPQHPLNPQWGEFDWLLKD